MEELPICLLTNSIQEESQDNLERGITRIKSNWIHIPKYNLITRVLMLKGYLITSVSEEVEKLEPFRTLSGNVK